MLEIELCKIDSLDQRREQSQVEIKILIATAKGIRLHELASDEQILDLTFDLFCQQEIESVIFTQNLNEIETKYKRNTETLYREAKEAKKSEWLASLQLEAAL